MAKLLVLDELNDSRVPFLRGMLAKSLQEAGLEFVDAYQLASDIREDFEDTEEVTTDELRNRIVELLEEDFPDAVLQRYKKEDIYRENLKVVYRDGHSEPFSRGIHAQRLENCSLPANKSSLVTRRVHSHLIKNKKKRIRSADLTGLTYREIHRELGPEFGDHYLILDDFLNTDRPLLVLIGGVPGAGKSTIATEISSRLGIVRSQSTDMLREVMRTLIPENLSPLLHTSSFSAGNLVEVSHLFSMKEDQNLLYGFQRQSEMVEVACEAVLNRALNEKVSMIVEGVHVLPSLMDRIPKSDAVVVPVMLSVLSKKTLIRYIKGRKVNTRQRRATRYLKHIDDIWQLQSAILSEADNADVEIINNRDRAETVADLLKTIMLTITASYRKSDIKALRSAHRKYLK